MEEFFDATVSWVHILSAVVFIGPQVFLVAAAIPAIRSVEDAGQRARALRTVTTRFAILGGVALALLLATGIWNYDDADDQGLIDADAFPRYYAVLFTKLTLVTIVIVISVLHGAVFGRRLQRLQESGASEAEVAGVRRWSMMASGLTLLLSLAILFCAALLDSDWSKIS